MNNKFLQYKKKYIELKGGSEKEEKEDVILETIPEPEPEEKHENPERRYRTKFICLLIKYKII